VRVAFNIPPAQMVTGRTFCEYTEKSVPGRAECFRPKQVP
jgi:hypothetical protein